MSYRGETDIPSSGRCVDGDTWERDERYVFMDIFLELHVWNGMESRFCRYVSGVSRTGRWGWELILPHLYTAQI